MLSFMTEAKKNGKGRGRARGKGRGKGKAGRSGKGVKRKLEFDSQEDDPSHEGDKANHDEKSSNDEPTPEDKKTKFCEPTSKKDDHKHEDSQPSVCASASSSSRVATAEPSGEPSSSSSSSSSVAVQPESMPPPRAASPDGAVSEAGSAGSRRSMASVRGPNVNTNPDVLKSLCPPGCSIHLNGIPAECSLLCAMILYINMLLVVLISFNKGLVNIIHQLRQ